MSHVNIYGNKRILAVLSSCVPVKVKTKQVWFYDLQGSKPDALSSEHRNNTTNENQNQSCQAFDFGVGHYAQTHL